MEFRDNGEYGLFDFEGFDKEGKKLIVATQFGIDSGVKIGAWQNPVRIEISDIPDLIRVLKIVYNNNSDQWKH